MARNRWGIPDWLEREVLARDAACIYCGVRFRQSDAPRRSRPSWEHIVNDARITTRENIALCCIGCNASKGPRDLGVWLAGRYCAAKGISSETVAPIVQRALRCRPTLGEELLEAPRERDGKVMAGEGGVESLGSSSRTPLGSLRAEFIPPCEESNFLNDRTFRGRDE